MRVIKLTHGSGNGIDTACLMTASNMLIGRGEDKDDNSCVCPVLRSFIIKTNDSMPLDLLGELYGPLAWEILGTHTGDRDIELKRAFRFVDWAIHKVLPIVGILGCPRVVDKSIACAAYAASATRTAHAADTAAHAAHAAATRAAATRAAAAVDTAANAAAYAAANAAAYAAANAAANAAAYAATRAADDAAAYADDDAAAAYAAAYAAVAAEQIWRMCPEIIREVAAIGDKRPVECVITKDELCEALV